jgi:hypothetical protein
MRQIANIFLKASLLPVLGLVILSGCTEIHTVPLPSSNVTLTPNPPIIYVAPFRMDHAQVLSGDDRSSLEGGFQTVDFKEQFQTQFTHELIKRLTKIAPTEERWQDDLPDHGWLVTGDFVTVYQGSRALRTLFASGNGQTTFTTNVYVYDLERSKTQYILAFRTGFPDNKGEGMGSGSNFVPFIQLGYGLKLDTVMTCRAIRDQLCQYFNPPIDVAKLN